MRIRGETGFEADDEEEDIEPVPPLGVAETGIGPGEDKWEDCNGDAALLIPLLRLVVFMKLV